MKESTRCPLKEPAVAIGAYSQDERDPVKNPEPRCKTEDRVWKAQRRPEHALNAIALGPVRT